VIRQFQPVDTDAPLLLVEGWAEMHAGTSPAKRAEWAWHSRELWLERNVTMPGQSYLRDLTSSAWYHRIDGPVYNVGGALAEYMVARYGIERFLALYFGCRPGRFEAECEQRLGVDLDTLESGFWDDVRRLAGAVSGGVSQPMMRSQGQ
jgi:hypothetical protein